MDAVPFVTFIIVDKVRWSVDSNLLYLISNESEKNVLIISKEKK